MPSAAVAGHYEIFNALQNKTEQNNESISLSFKVPMKRKFLLHYVKELFKL